MYCLHPIEVRKWKELEDGSHVRSNSYHLVPCNKCVACLSRRRNEWTFRLSKEKEMSDYTYFATLTYDQQHIPIRIKDDIPFYVFNKKHVQDYLKRVRHFINKVSPSIKLCYYLVSEYGGIGHRPHYHALFFIHGDHDLKHKKQLDMIFRDSWNCGFVTFKAATPANIHYVTKYCVKDLESVPDDCIDDVFIMASKSVYIGGSFEPVLQSQSEEALQPLVYNNGYRAAMPRIFRQKLGVPGLNVEMSDIDHRLSLDQEENFMKDYIKTHDYFDVAEFHEYVSKRLYAMEKTAERRQLKRTEKL